MNEKDYLAGKKRVWLDLLRSCLSGLGYGEDVVAESAKWIVEREEIIQQLRELCEEYGDNDWPDDLHLGDVIEKHLANHLYSNDG